MLKSSYASRLLSSGMKVSSDTTLPNSHHTLPRPASDDGLSFRKRQFRSEMSLRSRSSSKTSTFLRRREGTGPFERDSASASPPVGVRKRLESASLGQILEQRNARHSANSVSNIKTLLPLFHFCFPQGSQSLSNTVCSTLLQVLSSETYHGTPSPDVSFR